MSERGERRGLRRYLAIEDLAWCVGVWFVGAGELFVGNVVGRALVVAAGSAFLVACVLGDAEFGPVGTPKQVLASVGVTAVLVNAALHQQRAGVEWEGAFVAISALAFAIAALQSWRKRALVSVRPVVRRVLAWPFLMLAADVFTEISALALGLALGRGVHGATSPVERVFRALFSAGLMVLYYGFFVLWPRRLVHPREAAGRREWAVRFGFALLWSAAALARREFLG